MNLPMSRVRLSVLIVLLVVESALAISLRNSSWVATGHFIRSLAIAIACALPFVMTAVLLYRCRVDFRNRQFSMKGLMSLVLVVASYLALFSYGPEKQNMGPLPVARSAKFDVYIEAASGTSSGPMFTDTNTGEAFQVMTPAIVTAADVATVKFITGQENETQNELEVNLNSVGGNKLWKATSAAKGKKLAVVVNGQVLATPQILSPVGTQFRLSGGRIHTDGSEVFRALTVSSRDSK
jgi:SecDF, P1 head subdomain